MTNAEAVTAINAFLAVGNTPFQFFMPQLPAPKNALTPALRAVFTSWITQYENDQVRYTSANAAPQAADAQKIRNFLGI